MACQSDCGDDGPVQRGVTRRAVAETVKNRAVSSIAVERPTARCTCCSHARNVRLSSACIPRVTAMTATRGLTANACATCLLAGQTRCAFYNCRWTYPRWPVDVPVAPPSSRGDCARRAAGEELNGSSVDDHGGAPTRIVNEVNLTRGRTRRVDCRVRGPTAAPGAVA